MSLIGKCRAPGSVRNISAPNHNFGHIGSELSTPDFPSSYFLDHEIFAFHRLTLLSSGLSSSPQLDDAVCETSSISDAYFGWAHLWMPIISKKHWYTQHINPLMTPKPLVKVLLLCMKLLIWTPGKEQHERQPRTEEYLLAKVKIQEAEFGGAMSPQLLQAMLLLCVYEYAHGVYPAAFMTIAACARYAVALRLHKQRREDLTGDLEQQEENRRAWWAVIIMDRILSPDATCSPEPHPEDLLPAHDQTWDGGLVNELTQYHQVSSPASVKMGMFARLAQSSYLMGRVIRHTCISAYDAAGDDEERKRLQNALRALLNLMYEEGSTRLMPICPQTALCLTAMVLLNSTKASNTERSISGFTDSTSLGDTRETSDLLRRIADESLLTVKLYYRDKPWSLERSSPLLLHWSFKIAVTFLKISQAARHGLDGAEISVRRHDHDNHQEEWEARRGYTTMRKKLGLLGQQWCAADEYLRILDVRDGQL
jgi:hypothetical protein